MIISFLLTLLFGLRQAGAWRNSSLHPETIRRRIKAIRSWFVIILTVSGVLYGLASL